MIDQTEDTTMGRDLDGSVSPGHSTCRLPLAGGRGLTLLFGKPGPYPIPLTQVSLKSQAKPDPRAEPAGMTMASLQTGLLVPQKHTHVGGGS